MKITLIYNGGGFIVGVPARDLTADEAKKYNDKPLVESGLYSKPAKTTQPKKKDKGE